MSVRDLAAHRDPRGEFTELYRDEWELGTRAVQWNLVRSEAGVLRGVHVHRRHADLLTMADGEMVLALVDLRRASPTFRLTTTITLTASARQLAFIPPGIAHGFYFAHPATHIYAVDHAFTGADEFGCRWNDPGLDIEWPCHAPVLSERDLRAGSLADLLKFMETWS